MTKFTITIRATSIAIDNGMEAMDNLVVLLDMLTYEDEFVEETKTLGFMYDKQTDTLYLHKGVDISFIQKLLMNTEIVFDLYDEYDEMKFDYDEIIAPRDDDQVDVINFISGMADHLGNANESQLFLVKSPGFGKTFCTGVGLCKLKVKTLIIMHRDQLRGQWENSLRKMCGLTSHDIHEISSSEELYDIAHNRHNFDYDVYLMTHATFRAGLKRLSTMQEAMNITKNLKIGFKVIDEAHLEFRDTILMDMVFNVKRNLYLTATDGRSSKEENSIFRHVFANALYYKPSAYLTDNNRPKKWVEYIAVAVNSNCNKNIYRYRVAGGKGMSPATYGKWVIAYDKKKTHIKCCTEIIKMVYENDPYAKVLLFMPLIDLCEECAFYITTHLDKDETFKYDLDIRTINSKNSKKDNERAKHADVIVTTIGSCGTGTDIPGITTIISCSPFVSRITAAQVFGRIRYCGKVCQYYDIYDVSVQMDYIWWKSRRKGLTPIALNVKNLTWHEDET